MKTREELMAEIDALVSDYMGYQVKVWELTTRPLRYREEAIKLAVQLESAVAVATGAKIAIEALYEREGRDPANNDNYCRLADWLASQKKP